MMLDQTYATPEGYNLHRPLCLPDARSFAEVLTYCGEWDHAFMTNNGHSYRPDMVPAPRYEPETPAPSWRGDGEHVRNQIGPFCTIDTRQIGGPAHRSIAATITDAALDAVRGSIVTDDDHMSFQVIVHGARDGRDPRALIILQHGQIIGSHYLAYVDPETLPRYPFAARDRAAAEVKTEIENVGHEVYRRSTSEPYEIVYHAFKRGTYSQTFGTGYDWQGDPITIKPDGEVIR